MNLVHPWYKSAVVNLSISLPKYKRLLIPLLLAILLVNDETRQLTQTVLSDAFWQVSVFVAATLTIYHLFAKRLFSKQQITRFTRSSSKQVVFASLMGAIPGCGGAIIVMTQYISGSMSFGSVVAVLTATMGDAAFLLIAREPSTGIGIIIMSIAVGVVSGLIVDRIHGQHFLRTNKQVRQESTASHTEAQKPKPYNTAQTMLWRWLVAPGAIIGLLLTAQFDISLLHLDGDVINLLGAVVCFICIFLWAINTEVNDYETAVAEDKKQREHHIYQRVAKDTNFVTSWVVVAFLAFELLVYYANFNVANTFAVPGEFFPLIGVLLGMIPGCGPQIITTSLYLNGTIPLSAQIGNAISNDGDALFPAIALSPKVAIWATLYSAAPALFASYAYYWWFEV